MSAGFLPPIAEGFRLFTTHERISKAMADALEKGLQSSQADPYDTHPPLPERIAAVANLPAGPDPASAPPAISLLTDLPALERRWLAGLAGPAAVDKLAGVAWGSVMTSVVLPMWRDAVAKNAAALGGATVGDLGAVVVQSRERATFLAPAEGKGATPQDRDAVVRWLAAAGATLALERAGWTVASPPGAPVAARKDGLELLPFDVVESIRSGAITEDAWREESSRLGVGALPLVEAAAPAQP